MLNKVTIARPYARAAFTVAEKTNTIDNWLTFLSTLTYIVNNLKIIQFLKNPTINSNEKVLFLYNCIKYKSENFLLLNFLKILSIKNRLLLIPNVYLLFKSYAYIKENAIDIVVTTSILLKEHDQKELLVVLSKKFNKKVFVTFFVNPSLLGGILIKADNNVYNNSLKENLRLLYTHLIEF